MSNPYQTPPTDPYGGYGQAPQQAPQPPYQQQPQPGYGYGYPQQQPVYAPVQAPQQPNSFATAAVVIGFIAVLLSCMYGGVLGLIGLGIGIAGLNRSAATGLGRNASIGGIALNTLAVLITIALIVFYVMMSN